MMTDELTRMGETPGGDVTRNASKTVCGICRCIRIQALLE